MAACGRVGFTPLDDAGSGRVPPRGNVAFRTSTLQVPGSLGGLAGADAVCRARAQAAGLLGTFVAWVSALGVDAPDRLVNARGWYAVDGRPIADTPVDLANGGMLQPLRLDEYGEDIGESYTYYAATGTHGGLGNLNCGDFSITTATVLSGYPQYAGGGFSNTNTLGCELLAYLYCFQTDFDQPVQITRTAGRQAFVSTRGFDPASGLAPADALCTSDAAASGLGGDFRALLPGTASAASRFDDTGPTWVRVDGLALAETAKLMLASSAPRAPLNVEASGTVVDDLVMSGIDAMSAYAPPSALSSCDNWTNAAGTSEQGYSAATGARMLQYTSSTCDAPVRVYCLER
jgi:hypothetical protein